MPDKINFRFYQITDRKMVGEERQRKILSDLIAAGLRGLQIREKDLSSIALSVYVDSLLARLAADQVSTQLSILINSDTDLALARGLGLHRPEDGLATAEIRKLLGQKSLVGVSCHDLDGSLRAQDEGADFITLGPVFPSPSKGPEMGLESFRKITSRLTLPVFALGGITAENTRSCIEAGAHGVSVIRATLMADDPARAMKEILAEIE
jgi:thiamine-phosphate pyrophosphorylase